MSMSSRGELGPSCQVHAEGFGPILVSRVARPIVLLVVGPTLDTPRALGVPRAVWCVEDSDGGPFFAEFLQTNGQARFALDGSQEAFEIDAAIALVVYLSHPGTRIAGR
eukprot:CAMPEP_0206494298 /NCGR_PEP_ID=MMETSP0324_2-20121206/47630_1 /ASSEMBLY_ACC=CAM_ASM_000836 /TAXON_ID=2866 /ORGANISM="Crypthecodinium cohnii, Strain Seligo" /LENGTH=108 /DNA_ID=CAMNT_0053977897 /DNA_START=69 /DNA_END=396 /DNA_ORIENTATION=-